MFTVQGAGVTCDGDGWKVGSLRAIVFGSVVGEAGGVKADFFASRLECACFQLREKLFFA